MLKIVSIGPMLFGLIAGLCSCLNDKNQPSNPKDSESATAPKADNQILKVRETTPGRKVVETHPDATPDSEGSTPGTESTTNAKPLPESKILSIIPTFKPGLQDYIWVIDNGLTTDNYITQIKAGLALFAKAIAPSKDARMFLISRATGTEGYTLPAGLGSDQGFQQSVDINIGTGSALSYAFASLCAAALTTDTKLCDKAVAFDPNAIDVAGQLSSKIRPEAGKTLVIVSARDAEDLSEVDAQAQINELKKTGATQVFIFTRLPTSTACIANIVPPIFEKLSKNNPPGALHSLCADDWTKAVDELKALQAKSPETKYAVEEGVGKIEKVSIDGKDLDAQDYSLVNGQLSIDPKALPATAKQISVHYVPKP